jgi:plasmid stabilization system protein ParE
MKRYEVVFTPEAEEQLAELYRYIEGNATADVALRYTTAVVEYCEGLATFPLRWTPRDDIRPGLRTTSKGHPAIIDPAALVSVAISDTSSLHGRVTPWESLKPRRL